MCVCAQILTSTPQPLLSLLVALLSSPGCPRYAPANGMEVILLTLLSFLQVLIFSFLFGVLLHYIVKKDAEEVGRPVERKDGR